jgi:hypothetical protein
MHLDALSLINTLSAMAGSACEETWITKESEWSSRNQAAESSLLELSFLDRISPCKNSLLN